MTRDELLELLHGIRSAAEDEAPVRACLFPDIAKAIAWLEDDGYRGRYHCHYGPKCHDLIGWLLEESK